MMLKYRMPRYVLIAALFISMLAALPSSGQEVNLPRAKSPVTLFGFEGTGSAAWKGAKCVATTDHVSEGTQAMSFTLPKYEPGGDKWPMVWIDWNDGKGYSTKDWSHYGKLSFDVWASSSDENEPVLCLEVRDKPGSNGWSHKYPVKPGRMNTIVVDLADMKSEVDLENVQHVTFWGSAPPSTCTYIVDNFRLLPGDKPAFADFDLIYPNYREFVFPNTREIKLSASIHPEEYAVKTSDISLTVTATGGNMKIESESPFRKDTQVVTLSSAYLPAGPVALTANVVRKSNGQRLVTRTWTLQKLTKADVAALHTYIDENNNAIVDGKPFFPLGWYTSLNGPDGDDKYRALIADSPFNCVLDYGMNRLPRKDGLAYLDKLKARGLMSIYCMNDVYPSASDFKDKSWEGITGNNNIAQAVVNAYKDHPAVLAWYLNDELPKSLLPELTDYYQRVAKLDPAHPCYIVLCNMPELKYFPGTTDVMGVDPYPIPDTSVTKVSDWADIAQAGVRGHKPVWVVIQAFAWYQHNSENPDRSHIPTADELKTGRAPSYDEDRCMTYLALTHGAKGIMYWCYYDMRQLPQYDEMWAGMKKIGSEVKALSPMLLSPDDYGTVKYAAVDSGKPNIHTKLKEYNGDLYLMAVNSDSTPCSVTFDIRRKLSGSAVVMFENRSIAVDGAKLADTFKPLEVHVYNLGKADR